MQNYHLQTVDKINNLTTVKAPSEGNVLRMNGNRNLSFYIGMCNNYYSLLSLVFCLLQFGVGVLFLRKKRKKIGCFKYTQKIQTSLHLYGFPVVSN